MPTTYRHYPHILSEYVLLTVNGETKCVAEWCEIVSLKLGTVRWWIREYGKEYAEKRISEKLDLQVKRL